jgi:hypothetical protein
VAAGSAGTPVTTVSTVDPIKIVFALSEKEYLAAADRLTAMLAQPLEERETISELIAPMARCIPIKAASLQAPAGVIGAEPAPGGQENQYNVRTLGLLTNPQQFAEIIVRSNPDGSEVKIKDVGRVELGAQTYSLRARLNQSPAAALGIYLAPGANALATADQIKRILKDRQQQFPPDMKYEVTLDFTQAIKASLHEIEHTLIEAVILVLLVVFLFLQRTLPHPPLPVLQNFSSRISLFGPALNLSRKAPRGTSAIVDSTSRTSPAPRCSALCP